MISFKSKADIGVSVAIIAALLILVITGVVMLLPKQDEKVANQARFRSRDQIQDDIETLKKSIDVEEAKVAAKTWKLPLEQIGPKALEAVTGYAQKSKLKLVAFRPQKPNDVNGLTQIPFLISIEGNYLGVMDFVGSLESSQSNLATSLVQFSSTDGNSDIVTATIGVAAYTKVKPPKTQTPTTEKDNAKKTN